MVRFGTTLQDETPGFFLSLLPLLQPTFAWKCLASEAVRLMTRRGFAGRPKLDAIVARVHEDNPASARVLARLGYREEGRDPADPTWRLFRLRRREVEGSLAS